MAITIKYMHLTFPKLPKRYLVYSRAFLLLIYKFYQLRAELVSGAKKSIHLLKPNAYILQPQSPPDGRIVLVIHESLLKMYARCWRRINYFNIFKVMP